MAAATVSVPSVDPGMLAVMDCPQSRFAASDGSVSGVLAKPSTGSGTGPRATSRAAACRF